MATFGPSSIGPQDERHPYVRGAIALASGIVVLGFFWWAAAWPGGDGYVYWPQDTCDQGNVGRAGLGFLVVVIGAAVVLALAIAGYRRARRGTWLLWFSFPTWVIAAIVAWVHASQIGYAVSCD
jgi:hypothetical protein